MRSGYWFTVFILSFAAYGQQHESCPMHAKHTGVTERGDQAMGFSHEKTVHHFRLSKDGGAIAVEANDPKDTASVDQIRRHLQHIAQLFAAGDFNTPMFIHDQVPPGVPVMRRLKAKIAFRYEDTDRGGQVRVTTQSAEALEAIHQFLRFQITDHQTGDPLESQ